MTRVLIVEDDTQLQRAIAINLRARGYEIQQVWGPAYETETNYLRPTSASYGKS
jgi:DNA-binding response OmpR family regulator